MTSNSTPHDLSLPWDLGLLGASATAPHRIVYEPLFRAGALSPWKHQCTMRATHWLSDSVVLRFSHAPQTTNDPVQVLVLPLATPIARGVPCELLIELTPAWQVHVTLHDRGQVAGQGSLLIEDTLTPSIVSGATTLSSLDILTALAEPPFSEDLLLVLLSRLMIQPTETVAALYTLLPNQQWTIIECSLADSRLGLLFAEQWAIIVDQLPDVLRPKILLQLHQRATERADFWRQLAERNVDDLADAALKLVSIHNLQAQALEYQRMLAHTEGDTQRLDNLKREVTHYRELVDDAKDQRRAHELTDEQARLKKELEQLETQRRAALTEVQSLREQCEKLQDEIDSQLHIEQAQLERKVEYLKLQAEELPSLLNGLTQSDDPAVQSLIERINALHSDILEEGLNHRIEAVYVELRTLLDRKEQ